MTRHSVNKQVVLTDELKVCPSQTWEVLTPLTAEGKNAEKQPMCRLIKRKQAKLLKKIRYKLETAVDKINYM